MYLVVVNRNMGAQKGLNVKRIHVDFCKHILGLRNLHVQQMFVQSLEGYLSAITI